jgi:transcriptional regulator with XRE-family HTH domain
MISRRFRHSPKGRCGVLGKRSLGIAVNESQDRRLSIVRHSLLPASGRGPLIASLGRPALGRYGNICSRADRHAHLIHQTSRYYLAPSPDLRHRGSITQRTEEGGKLSELGRRITAACAYAGFSSVGSLADRIGLQPDSLRQIEIGAVDLEQVDLESVLASISDATGMPTAFFVMDLRELDPEWEPSHKKLERLEDRMDEMLERIDGLADRADEQLRVGSERLEQFAQIIISTERDKE